MLCNKIIEKYISESVGFNRLVAHLRERIGCKEDELLHAFALFISFLKQENLLTNTIPTITLSDESAQDIALNFINFPNEENFKYILNMCLNGSIIKHDLIQQLECFKILDQICRILLHSRGKE